MRAITRYSGTASFRRYSLIVCIQFSGLQMLNPIPESGSCPGAFPAGLWQRRVGGYSCPPNAPTSVGSVLRTKYST